MARKHPINRYCEAHGITKAELAERAGLSRAFLYNIASGRDSCSAEAARRIRAATKGEITCDDLLLFRIAGVAC